MYTEIHAENFVTYMEQKNQHNLNKTLLTDDNNSVTYGEFFSRVKKFATELKLRGFKPRDRIVFADDESIDYAVALFACWYCGVTTILISHKTLPANVYEAITVSDSRAIFCDNKEFDKMVPDGVQILAPNTVNVDHDELQQPYTFIPDEMVLWFVSSGTTGKQKMIVHRHLNLLNAWNLCKDNYDFIPEDIVFSTPKISFGYGFINFMVALGIGMTYIITRKVPSVKTVFDTVKKYKVTHLFTVPSVMTHLVKNLEEPIKSQSLRVVTSGSDYLPRTVSDRFRELFTGTLLEIYGLAEVMQEVSGGTLKDPASGTIGKAIPLVTVEIRRFDGSKCDVDEVGDIWVQHPYAALCYWNNYAKTKEFFQGNWLKPGDVGFIDNNGNINYVSRADSALKIKNMFVYPNEIETLLISNEKVKDCVVAPVTDEFGLYELETKIVTNTPMDPSEVRKFLSDKLDSFKIPKFIKFVETIDKTVTGKSIRHKTAV